jgi:DNA-directed RNA polymerase subunit M/transcription elongation factor TFIIS
MCDFLTWKEQPVDKCKTCGSDQLKIGITNIASGATVYPIYCDACGEVFAKYVKKIIAQEYAKENGPLKYVKTKTAEYIEKKQIQIKCEVCDANEGELHHWAPQYLFGDEANRWPVAYLCRTCHRKWHDLVTPNMSKKP